jgi:hypothetical protein
MSYQAEVSRKNPSCFLFMIDQSGSMADPFGASKSGKSKASGVATVINRLLHNIVIKCNAGDIVKDLYHVGVIGYGKNIGSGFTGPLAGEFLLPVSKIAVLPSRIEDRSKKIDDGAGGLVDETVKFPIWFDPIADGGTPMCEALLKAKTIIQDWISQHQDAFPPLIINITDGEATDGDPSEPARELQGLATSDGNVLLFNVHLSSKQGDPIEYPNTDSGLPDEFARRLFHMSSILPEHLQKSAQIEGYPVTESSRGFAYNADIVSVIQFLEMGTRPTNLR